MAEPHDPASLLVQNLARINRIAGSLCRRHGLGPDDTEDVASWAVTKLIENDYAVLRKFRGESSFTTFLTVVVTMLYRDFRVSELGRWRPSAAAKRYGEIAVRLETLVRRDGYELSQAGEVLRSSGKTKLSDRELLDLLSQLPGERRGRPKRVGDDPLSKVESGSGADVLVHQSEAHAERSAMKDAIDRVLGALPPEDQVILKMRFWQSLTVADISRTLGLEQKPLYRRLERLFAALRPELERLGISPDRFRDLMHHEEP